MGRKISIVLAVVVVGMLLLPALASATLVNEYGMHYAGQAMCLGCHARMDPDTLALHGRFATSGVSPTAPEAWTAFQAPGAIPPVAGTGQISYTAGGSYSITGLDWVTLGDSSEEGNSATEYLFFKGSSDPTVMPWNIVEGLSWEPGGEWMVAAEEPDTGLYDATYNCQRCHMLGTTMNGTGKTIPNPAASISPSAGTAVQWARDESKTVADFMSDASVSTPGLGIQCEQCHGTGQASATGHMITGVNVSTTLDVLGQSQVCGQCHGSFTTVAGTLGIYGYTTNIALRNFVDVNGVSGGQSYTKIPTETEFAASPAAYWMFPNGSNAKGGHYYYDEWAASAHSYRPALAFTSPDPAPADAMAFQASGKGVYSNNLFGTDTVAAGCYKCHTGEGYLQTKGDDLARTWSRRPTRSARWARSASPATTGIRPASERTTSFAKQTRQASVAPLWVTTTPASAKTATTGRWKSWARRRIRRRWPTSPLTAARATRSARLSTAAASCSTSPRAASTCPAPSAKTATWSRPTRQPTASRTA